MKTRLLFFLILINILTIQSSNISYNDCFKDYSQTIHQDTAILVVAYNRPQYFKECLASIERNPESQSLLFIFALDGGPSATQQENINLIEQSSITNKIILKRPYNYGCPKNHIDSKRFAFDWCKFKKIIVLEDDVIVSPSYCTFIINLHSWATQQYSNIGAVQGWSFCYVSPQEKARQLNYVTENRLSHSFLTYCIDDIAWNKIKSILYTFESFIDQIPTTCNYLKERSRPQNWEGIPQIRSWVQKLILTKKPTFNQKNILQSRFTATFKKRFLSPNFRVAQDIMMGFSFFMHDLVKLHSIVNRVIHIGKIGITSTEIDFKKYFMKINLDIFNEDIKLKNF